MAKSRSTSAPRRPGRLSLERIPIGSNRDALQPSLILRLALSENRFPPRITSGAGFFPGHALVFPRRPGWSGAFHNRGRPVTTTRSLSEILPKEMTELRVRPLFILLLEVQPAINVGNTPGVDRRVGVITGGRFEGERLRGTVLPGGSDWQAIRPGDGAWMLDVRILLKTDDGQIIGMPYRGMRHGPREVLDRIARGEVVKATDYYLRIAPLFETASEKYNWLNGVIGVGIGHRLPEGPIYQVFEVL